MQAGDYRAEISIKCSPSVYNQEILSARKAGIILLSRSPGKSVEVTGRKSVNSVHQKYELCLCDYF